MTSGCKGTPAGPPAAGRSAAPPAGPAPNPHRAARCLLCDGTRVQSVFLESGIPIVRCLTCRHVFSTYAGDPHYSGFWGDEVRDEDHAYWHRARVRMHQDFLDRFVVGRSGRLLDMGCGLGFFVRAVAAHPGWEAHGCEISEAAVRYANEVLSQPRVVRARLAEAPGAKASFDVITMWDVLDHILEPDVLLRRCHELLKPAGLLFIRTPNIAIHLPRARLKKLVLGERPGRSYLMARDHFHHYAPGTLRRLLERNGFSDVQFLHLHPIDNPSPSLPSRFARSCWLHLSRGLATATRGRLNIDNLYACARKRA